MPLVLAGRPYFYLVKASGLTISFAISGAELMGRKVAIGFFGCSL